MNLSTNSAPTTPLLTKNNTLWDAQVRHPTGIKCPAHTETWRSPARVSQLFDSTATTSASWDNTCGDDRHTDSTDGINELWAAPAQVPSFLLAEALVMPTDDNTTTTTNTITMTEQHTLWAVPAEPPSFCSLPPQLSAETQPPNTPTNNPILGHRNNTSPTHTHTLIFPTLSPIPITSAPLHPTVNETYIYYPPNNMIEHLPTRLTPLHTTYLFHPNLSLL